MNLKTRVRSAAMRHFVTAAYLEKQRARARKQRGRRDLAAQVHYFHQVDDPYSHLAVQKLDILKAAYNVPFVAHLVSKPEPAFQGNAQHFADWARIDAASVATDYSATFNPHVDNPAPASVVTANNTLAPLLGDEKFAQTAVDVGTALWSGQLEASAAGLDATAAGTISAGNKLRAKLGHYQGAMFYFDGEWFWGVDRMRLLELRLCEEGFSSSPDDLCVPEPATADSSAANASDITLEYFPSLRSPYTAIGHARVLELIKRSGVSTRLRPVMPMLMRGVPAPRAKQRYIITDAAREGRFHGVPFGRIVDPFGEPVKQAFALFPGAAALGRDMDFVTAYLQAAWFDGVDITTTKGLQQVAGMAAIDWLSLQQAASNTDWQAVLEDNLNAMLGAHLWGVPSFRVSGGNNPQAYACWGQDRIWRVANEIVRRAQS